MPLYWSRKVASHTGDGLLRVSFPAWVPAVPSGCLGFYGLSLLPRTAGAGARGRSHRGAPAVPFRPVLVSVSLGGAAGGPASVPRLGLVLGVPVPVCSFRPVWFGDPPLSCGSHPAPGPLPHRDILEEPKEEELMHRLRNHPHVRLCR